MLVESTTATTMDGRPNGRMLPAFLLQGLSNLNPPQIFKHPLTDVSINSFPWAAGTAIIQLSAREYDELVAPDTVAELVYLDDEEEEITVSPYSLPLEPHGASNPIL